MRSGTRRRALPALVFAVVLLVSALLATQAQAYVFWGFSAPASYQSGIGRAEQNGSDVSGQAISIPGADVMRYRYNPIREFGGDTGVVMDGAYVYWGFDAPSRDQSGIGRAKLSGSSVSSQFISIPGSYQIEGVTVSGNYIYWGWNAPSSDSAGIGRAELNGSHADDRYVSAPSGDDIDGLAANGSYVYWAWIAPSSDQSGIGRVALNGSHLSNGFISLTSRDKPSGLAVNGSYIYVAWLQASTDSTGIGRADLNGSHLNNGFISLSASDSPVGVGLDASYIYWGWTDGSNATAGVGRAKLNGSAVKQSFIGVSYAHQIGGIAVGGPPENTSIPTISGIIRQNHTLTEHHGSWLNAVSSYPDRWQRCNSTGGGCVSISGATHSTYELKAGDVGHTIRVQVTAKNASGAGKTATSAHTGKILPLPPSNVDPPTISANVSSLFTVGLNLTEAHGVWNGSPTSYGYQWDLCHADGTGCTAVPGATGQTFPLASADVGSTLRVQETATNAGGTSTPATSVQTPVVLPLPPVNVTAPSIAGDLYVTASAGQTLSAVPGTWTNTPTTSVSYQWILCSAGGSNCEAILNATASTYPLIAGQAGDAIEVQETATNSGGKSLAATSHVSGPIGTFSPEFGGAFAPTNSLAPVISGMATPGQTLTASSGAWEGSPTLTYTYTWQVCTSPTACTDAAVDTTTATSATYTLTSSEGGDTVEAYVGATNGVAFSGTNAVGSDIVTVN